MCGVGVSNIAVQDLCLSCRICLCADRQGLSLTQTRGSQSWWWSWPRHAVFWLKYMCVCADVCVWGVNPCFQGICDFSVFQFFSFKAGGASSPFSLAPTKTLDECWWYLTWSVRRTCHETISISEFCDSFTAATVLNLSLFKTCLSTTAFSRAKSHKSIWASWTDILSYKCVTGRDSVMALSWSWLSQATESPPLKRISKILKWTLWIVSVSWPQIRILWFSPYQSTSVNMKHTQLDWDSFSIFLVVPLSE